MIRRLKEQVLSEMLPEKRREIVRVAVARDSQQELATLLSQRAALITAQSDPSMSREQLARAKTDQQALTARLCKLTGVAKAKGVIAHLKVRWLIVVHDVTRKQMVVGLIVGSSHTERQCRRTCNKFL